MSEIMKYVIGGVFTLVGFMLFFMGFKKMDKYRLIKDTPTSKIRSMAMGLVEVHGNVLANEKLITPFSKEECVYYKYEIKEYQRTTSTDSKGNTRTSHEWKTIATGENSKSFFAKDNTGVVYVNPKSAEFKVNLKKKFLQKAGLFGGIGRLITTLQNWNSLKAGTFNVNELNLEPQDISKNKIRFSRVGDRMYYEYYICPDENLFVLGTAKGAKNVKGENQVIIQKGDNNPAFIISDKNEKELLKTFSKEFLKLFIFGGLLIVGGILLLLFFAGVI